MKKNRLIIIVLVFTFIFSLMSCKNKCGDSHYTINYNTSGGEKLKDEKYELGKTAVLPTPTKQGFQFLGWYKDNRFIDGPYVDINLNKPQKITLYANWMTDKEYNEFKELQLGLEVIELIDKIPEQPKSSDLVTIQKAKELYDKLPVSIKEIIYNYSNLEKTLELLPNLIIEDIKNEIESLPYYITYSFAERVKNIMSKYESLNDEYKANVTNYEKLKQANEDIKTIEEDEQKIVYVFGEYIYDSIEELHTAFFTEFYYFILNNDGENTLIYNEIRNVNDFLELSLNYNAGRGEMRDLGDKFGSFFLTKDVNGIVENQPTSTFIGYCYHHNKFVEVIEFFIRFFAYWRIDEKYANRYNYGADMFAESWAPLVDICKFFYYNASTSYVQSSRVLECFKNPVGVATTYDDKLGLPIYNLRGYNFDGWYSNSNFKGEKITNLPNGSTKQFLYAKWSSNSDYQAKEKAQIVDIYIYNLTTIRSICNNVTVQYVYDMFKCLPYEAKRYVVNKDILQGYVEIYNIE